MELLDSLLNLGYKRNWDYLLAKGGKYKETSLINHSFSVASITYDLLSLKEDFFTQQEIELATVAAFLHDLDKETQEFQNKLKTSGTKSIQHLPPLNKFLEVVKELEYSEVEGKFAYACLIHTHMDTGEAVSISSIKSELISKLNGESLRVDSISFLGDFIRLADALSSSENPKKVVATLQNETFSSLLHQLSLKFGMFSLDIIRGHLSYLLLESAEEAFSKQNFRSLVNFPNGIVAFSATNDIDYNHFSQDFVQTLKENLLKLFVHEDFLKESINMQINRSMIGEESIITLESLESLIKFSRVQITYKSYKAEEGLSSKMKKEAILLRFVVFLLLCLKNKAAKLYPKEKEDISKVINEVQQEIFGQVIDGYGKTQKYEIFRDMLYNNIEPFLIKNEVIDRSFDEMTEEKSLDIIENLGIKVARLLKSKLSDYDELTLKIDEYLEQLIDDVHFPVIQQKSRDIFSQVANAFRGYEKAKNNIMGTMNDDVRCPICGSVKPGTTAKKASVGEGTKRFTNLGKGYGSLNNVNICMLCAIEGILRKGKQLTFFVFPEVPFSPSQLNHIHSLYMKIANLSLKHEDISREILFSTYNDIRNKVIKAVVSVKDKKKTTFLPPQKIRGNYLVLSVNTFPKTSNTTTEYLLLALSGIYLQIITGMRIKIVQGLDILDVEKSQGYVEFPVTQNMLSILELKQGSLILDQIHFIGEKISLGYLFWKHGNISESGGIIQALRVHPGQVLERVMLTSKKKGKKKGFCLKEIDFQIFSKAKVKIMENEKLISKESIAEKLAELLEEYYWTQANSMHMILGPVSTLYDEYRKTTKYTDEVAQYIAGKIYRKLEMQSKKEHGLEKAAEEIYNICLSLNKILSSMSLRQKKKYLDNLRYSVYLLRVMAINERYCKKKEKKEDEK